MRRIIAQTRKELTQIVRDWRMLLLAIILPLILLMLLGNAISLSVTDMPMVVQDLDDSPSSRQSTEPPNRAAKLFVTASMVHAFPNPQPSRACRKCSPRGRCR